jgi:hypothetical protein
MAGEAAGVAHCDSAVTPQARRTPTRESPMPSTLLLPPPTPSARAGRRRRRTKLAVAAAGVAVLVPIGMGVASEVPRWTAAPFAEQTVDRSPAPLLLAMRDLAQYHAATGAFQVLVDVEHDTPYLPRVISGERTTLFASGNVDAVVDFSALGPGSVVVSPDRRSATITLPAPTLTPAAIDPVQSRVVGRERGLAQRLGDAIDDHPADDSELYRLAGQKLDAAAAQSDLSARGADNTRRMLTGLAGSLGYDSVTVTFDAPAPARQ